MMEYLHYFLEMEENLIYKQFVEIMDKLKT